MLNHMLLAQYWPALESLPQLLHRKFRTTQLRSNKPLTPSYRRSSSFFLGVEQKYLYLFLCVNQVHVANT